MRYNNIYPAVFINRPNRFIANIEIDGAEQVCHVKNTGRCGELLVDRAEIYVQKNDNPSRKTMYDLIAVKKGNRIVNMDSQAPNYLVKEWLLEKNPFGKITYLKPEQKCGNSRFDFYMETENSRTYIEVKGVTLENNNVVSFPDAPSQRAVKHLKELCELKTRGYDCYVIFVVQMENVKYFRPETQRHEEFAQALIEANNCGVRIMAVDCRVEKDFIIINKEVGVRYE